MLNLYPHQVEACTWLQARKYGILADQMRLGKSLSTAAACLDRLPALIVCPASVKFHWRKEFLRLNPNLKIETAEGGKFRFTSADVYIINYDLLGKVLIPEFKTLVIDEAHRIKSHLTARTEHCTGLIRRAQFAYALTGTPMPSKPIELWPLLHAMGITDKSWHRFATRYARGWQAPWGFDASGASNLPELRALIAPHMLRRTKEQVFGKYVPQERTIITFDRAIDKRESQFNLNELYDHPNPLLSFEGLAEVVKASALKKIPDALEFIEGILAEQDKVIVFAHHKEVVDALRTGLKKYHPVVITGATPTKDRGALVEQFKTAPTARVFIGNILAAGEGIDLSVADTVVFVETSWVPKDIDQASARTENMTKLNAASSCYFLTTEASIDHIMLKRVLEKTDVIDQVIKISSPVVQHLKELKMKDEIAVRIAEALEALVAHVQMQNAGFPTTKLPKATKAKSAPVENEAEVEVEIPAPTKAAAPVKELTVDDVRTLLIALGKDKAKAMLADYGVTKVLELTKEQLAEIYAKVKA